MTCHKPSSSTPDSRKTADRLVEIAEANKATDIFLYDLKEASVLADFFLICSAGSEPHLRALANHFRKDLPDLSPKHIEGAPASRWMIIDFTSVVVHVFHPEMREHYKLEALWENVDIIYRGGEENQEPTPVF